MNDLSVSSKWEEKYGTKNLQRKELVTQAMEELKREMKEHPEMSSLLLPPGGLPSCYLVPGTACAKALRQEDGGVVGELRQGHC